MQLGFFFDQTLCYGCHTCNTVCQVEHHLEFQVNFRHVEAELRPFAPVLSYSCLHCESPACAQACPVGAIAKRVDDGIVLVDAEKCLGKDNCDMCKTACPYTIPQFGTAENAKMQMCNLCIDRIQAKKRPICVVSCPADALDFGPMEELVAKHGGVRNASGFEYSATTRPSVVFKPHSPER